MTIGELLQKYADGREKLSELKAEYDVKKNNVEAFMQKIASKLQEYAKEQGLEKLSSSDWTMYWSKSDSPRITNSTEFFEYVVTTQNFDLLEKRVAKLATMAIIKEGGVIPGIDVWSEIKPNLRKVS